MTFVKMAIIKREAVDKDWLVGVQSIKRSRC